MDDDDFYANAKSPSAKSPSLTMAELKKRASAQKQKAKELQTSAKLRGDMAKIKAQQMAAEGKVRAKAAKESAKAEAAVAKEKAKHAKEKGKHEAAVAKQKAALAREGHHEKLLEERERQREFERAKDQSRLRSQQAVGVSTVAELRAQLNFAWGKYDEVDPRREAKVKGKAKEQAGLHIVMAAGTYTLDDDLKLGWGVRLTGWSDESEAEEGHADWNKTILLLPPGREIKAVGRAQLEDVLVRDGDLEGRSTPLIYVSGGQVVGEKAQLTLSNCDIEGGVANVSGELVMAKCKVRNAPATAIHCYTREGGRSEFTSCEIDGPGGSGIIVDAPLPPAKSETLLTKCKVWFALRVRAVFSCCYSCC